MKKAIVMVLGIFLLSFASAIYAGECSSINISNLEKMDIIYMVVGNSSNTEGMSLEQNGTIIEICFDILYKSDNLTLVFMNKQTKEIIKEVKVSSKRRTKYIYENITEYINVEKIVYVDKIINECENDSRDIKIIEPIEEDKIGFFDRIWNWIKNLFKN